MRPSRPGVEYARSTAMSSPNEPDDSPETRAQAGVDPSAQSETRSDAAQAQSEHAEAAPIVASATPSDEAPPTAAPESIVTAAPIATAPEATKRSRARWVGVGIAALVAIAALAVSFEASSVERDEGALWAQANRSETEQDWARYVAWAETTQAGLLSGPLARLLTPITAHQPLAIDNEALAHVEAAIEAGAWAEVCAARASSPGSRAGTRAEQALRNRIDAATVSYVGTATAAHAAPALANAVRDGMSRARDLDPCAARAVLRVRYELDVSSTDLSLRAPGGAGAPTIAAMLDATHDADRASLLVAGLAADLETALGGVVEVVPASDEGDDPTAAIVLEIVSTLTADRRYLTAAGTQVPSLAMRASTRVFVRAADGTLPGLPTAAGEAPLHLTTVPALAIGEARDAAALAPLYTAMRDELDALTLARVRGDLGLGWRSPSGAGSSTDCPDSTPLPIGRVVHGSTRDAMDVAMGGCSREYEDAHAYDDCMDCDYDETDEPPESPEVTYRLVVPARSHVAVEALSDDGRPLVVYLRSRCGDETSEIACHDDEPLTEVLDEGVYTLVVDETDGGSGRFDLIATSRAPEAAPASCAAPTPLALGQDVTGNLAGGADESESHCGGVGGRERRYAVTTDVPSRLRCAVTGGSDARVVSIRSDCADPETEVDCAIPVESTVGAVVPAGTSIVTVEGDGPDARGNFTLRCETAAVDAADAATETCEAASALAVGTTTIDNLRAHDDVRVSCGTTGTPDIVRRLDLRVPSHVRLTWPASSGMVAALLTRCGDTTSELGCSAVAIETDLDPGTYYVVLDGTGPHLAPRDVTLEVTDLTAACAGLAPVTNGPLVGTLRGGTRLFHGTCVAAGGSEAIRRIDVSTRSRLVVTATQPFSGGVYVRRSCSDWHSELACGVRPPSGGPMIDTTLDPGSYALFVDSPSPYDAGTFALDVSLTPTP